MPKKKTEDRAVACSASDLDALKAEVKRLGYDWSRGRAVTGNGYSSWRGTHTFEVDDA